MTATEDNPNGSAYKKGEVCYIVNDVFDPQNGLAYFDIGKGWEINWYTEFTGRIAKDTQEIYEGDTVLVRGRKLAGLYETTVIRSTAGFFTLAENKTYLHDYAALTAIVEVIKRKE